METGDGSSLPQELKACAKLSELPRLPDGTRDEILHEIALWIGAGNVRVEEGNQKYFDLLERRYPIGFNRIEWRGVGGHSEASVLPVDQHVISYAQHVRVLSAYRKVLKGWFDKNGIGMDDRVVCVGDDTDVSLRMTIGTLLECFPELFAIPQHSYVFPEGGSWCLNYTMEGQLFFGVAANAIARGSVELGDSDSG